MDSDKTHYFSENQFLELVAIYVVELKIAIRIHSIPYMVLSKTHP